MSTNILNVKCTLTIDDAIAWNYYYMENSAQWKNNWKLMRFVFLPIMVACFIIGIIYFTSSTIKGLGISVSVASIMGIILGASGFVYFLFYPYMLRRKIRNTAKQVYGQGKNSFVGTHKYTASPEGIRDNAEAIVKWTAIEDIVQTDNYLFILVYPQKAIIIPKKAFPNEDAINRFMPAATALFQAAQKNGEFA